MRHYTQMVWSGATEVGFNVVFGWPADALALAKLHNNKLKARAWTIPFGMIAAEKDFDHEFCRVYYRKNLRFHFGKKEKEGLRLFQRLCAKHSLLPDRELELMVV